MVPFVIRLATRSDVSELERLIGRSVRQLFAGYYGQEQIEASLVHVFGVDTQLVDDGTYYVASEGEAIVGCGGWSRRRTLFGGDRWKAGAEDDLLDPAGDAARIRAFFVAPESARRGIGRRIMKLCEAAAAREGFSRLELVATLPGVPLYTAMGYVAVEPIVVPLPDAEGLAAVRMWKAIVASDPEA